MVHDTCTTSKGMSHFQENGCAHIMLKGITSCQEYLHLCIYLVHFLKIYCTSKGRNTSHFSEYLQLFLGFRFPLMFYMNLPFSVAVVIAIRSAALALPLSIMVLFGALIIRKRQSALETYQLHWSCQKLMDTNMAVLSWMKQ